MNELHAKTILDSYYKWTNTNLLNIDSNQPLLKQLDEAPFAILSHGTESDPILNYGNRFTLDLWQMSLDELCSTPSRLTAEPMEQGERARFMEEVTEKGFVSNYTGIRISKGGKRFYIRNATVFNLVNSEGKYIGQAATFKSYHYL